MLPSTACHILSTAAGLYSTEWTCPTPTAKCKPWRWDAKGNDVPGSATGTWANQPTRLPRPASIEAGDINCRYDARTYDEVGPDTCARLAERYGIALDKFYVLNPQLAPDCRGIAPNTEYCVRGFIEPLRAYDGLCGPHHKNATCIGVDWGQCCSSKTWTCGEDVEEHCAPGICYEGVCWGHKVWTTDGTCGRQNEGRRCAGRWGDCCSTEGKCGSGPEFCGEGRCQSGKCDPLVDHFPDRNQGAYMFEK